ncbi:PilZ domain-containing protein [Candidatus Auribacterota bacterium]
MKNSRERRKEPRVEVDGEVLLDISTKNFIKPDSINISPSGIFFISNAAMALFRELEIRMVFPAVNKNCNAKIVKCHAVVVRCEERGNRAFGVFLYFIEMTQKSKSMIEEYVHDKCFAKKPGKA